MGTGTTAVTVDTADADNTVGGRNVVILYPRRLLSQSFARYVKSTLSGMTDDKRMASPKAAATHAVGATQLRSPGEGETSAAQFLNG
ncbi:hypothetical protein V5799_019079 [Amblyomma americanum]|uniref:Uncharacterized protein n=1 Tax=Amblyomma americanum TaxID=6943 RepID=A0AAQ4EXX6_AMBAM